MERIFSGIHKQKHIIAGVQVCFEKTICFATVAFALVSFHSITIATGKGKSDSICASVIQRIEELCSGNADSLPCLKKFTYVSRTFYVLLLGKTSCF